MEGVVVGRRPLRELLIWFRCVGSSCGCRGDPPEPTCEQGAKTTLCPGPPPEIAMEFHRISPPLEFADSVLGPS